MLNTVYPNYIPQRPVYNNNQAMIMKPQIAPIQPIQNPVPMPSVQPVAPIQQTQIASLEAANAIKAYSTPFIYQTMPETSNEYIMRLKNTGKVEGKDFRIEKGDGYIDVVELDAGNKMIKSSAWNLIDGKDKPLVTEDLVYKGDRILYRDAKTPDGKIEHHAHHYYNDEIPQSTISHDGLTFETKVEDYIKNLQQKGIKYTEQIEQDSAGQGTSHIVEEYDNNGKQTLKTVWVNNTQNPELSHVCRDLFNADNTVNTTVVYDKEKTVVVNFFNKRN